jgi:hypothetical protein
MFTKSLPLLLAILGLTVLMSQTVYGHDKAEGTIVQVKEGKLTFTSKGSDKKNTYDIAKEVTVSLDGKPAKTEDLKEGFTVALSLGEKHIIKSIVAQSKPKK